MAGPISPATSFCCVQLGPVAGVSEERREDTSAERFPDFDYLVESFSALAFPAAKIWGDGPGGRIR